MRVAVFVPLLALAVGGFVTPAELSPRAISPVAGQALVTLLPAGTVLGRELPTLVEGRVVSAPDGDRRQWPTTSKRAGFAGRSAAFVVGEGEVALDVWVDGVTVARLVRPTPGAYAVGPLRAGPHELRVRVTSESQARATVLGELYGLGRTSARPASRQARQVEFIGDSHSVGYGVRSERRECDAAKVWQTTDSALAAPSLLARRWHAELRVNAISGRGVVRNYAGGAGNTLPNAYSYALLDHGTPAPDDGWHPQLIVVGLGTNDFSTPIRAGEPWSDAASLRAAFRAGYTAFLARLRARHPGAAILLWIADTGSPDAVTAVREVAVDPAISGSVMGPVVVTGLDLSACHSHPSIADQRRIAERLTEAVAAVPDVWEDAGV